MTSPYTQPINRLVCDLNLKIDEVNAVTIAIEMMLCEVSWGNGKDPVSIPDLSDRISKIHTLACIAKKSCKEAVEMGNTVDSATLTLLPDRAA